VKERERERERENEKVSLLILGEEASKMNIITGKY